MLDTDKTPTHARLMSRMARITGADLDALTDQNLSAALTRCCNCGNVGTCEDWLDDHADGGASAPGFCANKAVMQTEGR